MSVYQANAYPALTGYHGPVGNRWYEPLRQLLVRLTAWSTERSQFHQTVAELERLSDRELADIGISRVDITAIARESVRAKRTDV